jgi:hypothetical protein
VFILNFVRNHPESKLIPKSLEKLLGYEHSKILERRVFPYGVLGSGFRDLRKGPGGLLLNEVKMDFEFEHGPWPQSTSFSKGDNLWSVSARTSEFDIATGGSICFRQWAILGEASTTFSADDIKDLSAIIVRWRGSSNALMALRSLLSFDCTSACFSAGLLP